MFIRALCGLIRVYHNKRNRYSSNEGSSWWEREVFIVQIIVVNLKTAEQVSHTDYIHAVKTGQIVSLSTLLDEV
jgi:hypothetical protein